MQSKTVIAETEEKKYFHINFSFPFYLNRLHRFEFAPQRAVHLEELYSYRALQAFKGAPEPHRQRPHPLQLITLDLSSSFNLFFIFFCACVNITRDEGSKKKKKRGSQPGKRNEEVSRRVLREAYGPSSGGMCRIVFFFFLLLLLPTTTTTIPK